MAVTNDCLLLVFELSLWIETGSGPFDLAKRLPAMLNLFSAAAALVATVN